MSLKPFIGSNGLARIAAVSVGNPNNVVEDAGDGWVVNSAFPSNSGVLYILTLNGNTNPVNASATFAFKYPFAYSTAIVVTCHNVNSITTADAIVVLQDQIYDAWGPLVAMAPALTNTNMDPGLGLVFMQANEPQLPWASPVPTPNFTPAVIGGPLGMTLLGYDLLPNAEIGPFSITASTTSDYIGASLIVN